ncbi:MAG: alpha/beta fold hydrolase [Lysobacterales bacterium]
MNPAHDQPKPPSRLLLALESRAVFEWASFAVSWPWLKRAPRGDGHPVLVLPGLVAGDASTYPLRRFLEELGYAAHPWKLGVNFGPRGETVPKLIARVRQIQRKHGQKVSLVGWSLGGAMARALGARMPEHVRNVITLGSPVQAHARATNAWKVFEAVSGWRTDDPELHELASAQPSMPNTSIFSKADGIVSWKVSLAPEAPCSENIEVAASHLGMGVNPLVLWAIADRLSQPEGGWKPFERAGLVRSLLYRKPHQFRLAQLL